MKLISNREAYKKNFLSKKAFTLVELIGVVIILALIALLAFPPILNSIRKTKFELSDASKEVLYNATDLYVSKNLNDFPKREGNTFCITLETLVTNEYLPTKVYDSTTGEEIPLDSKVEVKVENDRYTYNMNNECEEYVYKPPFDVDNSGANTPELLDNMVPIYYNGENWIVSDGTQQSWYNYETKGWANAAVLNTPKKVGDVVSEEDIELWYVWIPRYTYTIFNGNNGSVKEQEIQIKFESGTNSSGTVKCVDAVSGSGNISETCTDTTNGSIKNGTSTYTHPAFTFGDEQLTGFWVGKFEISGSTDKITIKPNVSSLRNQTVSSFFNSILNMKTVYNLNGNSHMMKNMEWGAVAYLSHSKYGTCTNGSCVEVGINNNSSYITGCGSKPGSSESSECNSYNTTTGMLASTTQNIYGVYDMSGGAWERLMGNMANENGLFYSNDSGFNISPDSKYYDRYTYGTSNVTHGRGKLGDAIKETLKVFGNTNGGWYNDFADFIFSTTSWVHHGGDYKIGSSSGLFSFGRYSGNAYFNHSTRAVLVK